MKTVEFLGKQWDVPDWAKWITQDENTGDVYVWNKAPVNEGGIYYPNGDTEYENIGFHRVLPTIKEI